MKYSSIVVIGSGSLAYKIATLLKKQCAKVLLIEKTPIITSFNEKLCKINDIPYCQLSSKEITTFLRNEIIIKKRRIFIISAINTYIFPQFITDSTRTLIINYHNSLLPKYPGMNTEAWQIFDENKTSGITWHIVTKNIDSGNILIQKSFPLSEDITSINLLKKQSMLAFKAFQEIINDTLSFNLKEYTPSQNSSFKTKMHKIKDIPNNGILNLNWKGNKISAFLRAFDYGVLNTLGTPKVFFNGKFYNWRSYKIKRDFKNSKIILKTDSNRLIYHCDNYVFSLEDFLPTKL